MQLVVCIYSFFVQLVDGESLRCVSVVCLAWFLGGEKRFHIRAQRRICLARFCEILARNVLRQILSSRFISSGIISAVLSQ